MFPAPATHPDRAGKPPPPPPPGQRSPGLSTRLLPAPLYLLLPMAAQSSSAAAMARPEVYRRDRSQEAMAGHGHAPSHPRREKFVCAPCPRPASPLRRGAGLGAAARTRAGAGAAAAAGARGAPLASARAPPRRAGPRTGWAQGKKPRGTYPPGGGQSLTERTRGLCCKRSLESPGGEVPARNQPPTVLAF